MTMHITLTSHLNNLSQPQVWNEDERMKDLIGNCRTRKVIKPLTLVLKTDIHIDIHYKI